MKSQGRSFLPFRQDDGARAAFSPPNASARRLGVGPSGIAPFDLDQNDLEEVSAFQGLARQSMTFSNGRQIDNTARFRPVRSAKPHNFPCRPDRSPRLQPFRHRDGPFRSPFGLLTGRHGWRVCRCHATSCLAILNSVVANERRYDKESRSAWGSVCRDTEKPRATARVGSRCRSPP